MGRRKRGLYDGKHVRTGNNVSFSKRRCVSRSVGAFFLWALAADRAPLTASPSPLMHRTRRTFMPNIVSKRVFSLALDEWLHFRMSTEALRNIDKAGGVDAYLLAQPLDWLKSESEVGYAARLRIEAAMDAGDAPVAADSWAKKVRRGAPPPDYVCMYTGVRGAWKENSKEHKARKAAGFPPLDADADAAIFDPYHRRYSGTH